MAQNIRTADAAELAEREAGPTGETRATIIHTFQKRQERLDHARKGPGLAGRLSEIARHAASLPLLDGRPPDEILGYDDNGLPGSWS